MTKQAVPPRFNLRQLGFRAIVSILLLAVVGGGFHWTGGTNWLFPRELSFGEQEQREEALRRLERIEVLERQMEQRLRNSSLLRQLFNGKEIRSKRRQGDRFFRRSDYQSALELYTLVHEAYESLAAPYLMSSELREIRDASYEARKRWVAHRRAFSAPAAPAAQKADELHKLALLSWQDQDARKDAWLQAIALWEEALEEAEARLVFAGAERRSVREQVGERFDELVERLSYLNAYLAQRFSESDEVERRKRMNLYAERGALRAELSRWGLSAADTSDERTRAMNDFMTASALAASLDDLDAMLNFLERRLQIAGH